MRGIKDAKEETWFVFRRGDPLVDPDTERTLAYEPSIWAQRSFGPGDPATVVLTSAVQEVLPGDKLLAAGQPQTPNYAPHAPTGEFKGR